MDPQSPDPLDQYIDAGVLDEGEFRNHALGTPEGQDPVQARDLSLVRLAVERGLITPGQLAECLQEQRRSVGVTPPRLTEILRLRAWIGAEVLSRLVAEAASTPRIGQPASVPSGIPVPDSVIGARRLGKYAVLEKLGQGGMAEVFRAYDLDLGRFVAIKFLRAVRPSDVARLRREAQITAQFTHPGLAQVYDFILDGDEPAIVMPFISGTTLDKARLPRLKILEVMADVCDAVAHAHARGVIHRDLKPQNIMVETQKDGRVKAVVMDFGLARGMAVEGRLTVPGAVVGTPYYMPPEQAAGNMDLVDASSDVYSLGASLYHLITGVPAHQGGDFARMLHRIQTSDPALPRSVDPTISRDLEAVLNKAMSRSKGDRYTAEGFAADLRHVLNAEPVTATRIGWASRSFRRLRRAWPLVAGLTVVALCAAVAAWAFATRNQTSGDLGAKLRAAEEGTVRLADANKALDEAATWVDKATRHHETPTSDRAETDRMMDEALRRLDRADQLVPRMARALFIRGRAWELMGWDDRAEESWRAAVKADPKHGLAHFELGRRLLFRVFTARIVRLNQDLRENRRNAADWAREAAREFRAALESGFDDEPQRLLAEAMLAQTEGNDVRASDVAKSGLSKGALADEFNWILGMVSTGDERVRRFSDALTIRPAHFMARFCRAIESSRLEDIAAILADYAEVIRLRPRFAHAYVARCLIRVQTGDLVGALSDVEKAVELCPADYLMLGDRGHVRFLCGDVDGALQDVNETIRRRQDYGPPYLTRARILEKRGDESALGDFSKATEYAPSTETHFARGRYLQNRKDFRSAIEDFTRALDLQPDHWTSLNNRGVCRRQTGDPAGAVEDFTRALGIVTGDPDLYVNRGNARQDLKDFKGALEDYRKALEVGPADWPRREAVTTLVEQARQKWKVD